MRDWMKFFSAVHTVTEIDKLKSCEAGPKCGESEDDRWHCCGAAIRWDRTERVCFPYENDWLRMYGEHLPKGCSGCGYRKTILCGLWPVVPVVTAGGEWMVGLQMSCEAFVLAPKFYEKHVRVASDVAQLLVKKFPSLIGQFVLTTSWLNDGPKGIELRVRDELAIKMMRADSWPQIVKTFMHINKVDNLCDDVRKLPVLK